MNHELIIWIRNLFLSQSRRDRRERLEQQACPPWVGLPILVLIKVGIHQEGIEQKKYLRVEYDPLRFQTAQGGNFAPAPNLKNDPERNIRKKSILGKILTSDRI
jgi:hypothetical protein